MPQIPRRAISFEALVRRIADRQGVQAATRWTTAVLKHQQGIDEATLRNAIAAGDEGAIAAAVKPTGLAQGVRGAVRGPFLAATVAGGTGGQQILQQAGLGVTFNASHPNVALFARQQAADLVVGIPEAMRQVIAEVIALGHERGLTIEQQARALREVVGLPPSWASAPQQLADEILGGNAARATSRRLSAATKQKIRSRIQHGTVTLAFVDEVKGEYARSLVRRRALNISRTETLRSAHAGLHESWQQAIANGELPRTARRFWVVTPDSRLSPEHARIPGMNVRGRGIREPFMTPDGVFMYPPSRPNCRCGVALLLRPRRR